MNNGWNLWHGCQKFSEGCANCYVYRQDDSRGNCDTFIVRKTADFDLPIRKTKSGEYKLKAAQGLDGNVIYTCMTSDFFIEDADLWRPEAWRMMKERPDLMFYIFTKRIHRFEKCTPPDWGDGYDNVIICCTAENQRAANNRLPIFVRVPIKHRMIACAPLLEQMDISEYLCPENHILCVSASGESGTEARLCKYDWILSLRDQCKEAGVGFYFHQTGAFFEKDGRLYRIKRQFQGSQAKRANIDIPFERR